MLDNATTVIGAQDIVWIFSVIIVCFATIIQKISKSCKPWSWLAEQFGKAVNKEMLDKLDKLEKKVDELEKIDRQQDEDRAKDNALESRRRILRFADECRRHEKHSEEYFNNILEDVSTYKDYCQQHPLFENEKAIIAISIVEKVYKHCYENDDFL